MYVTYSTIRNTQDLVIIPMKCRSNGFLEFSGCRTRPLKISRYRPRFTQRGEYRNVIEFRVNGTNQTKERIWGRNPALKEVRERYTATDTQERLCESFKDIHKAYEMRGGGLGSRPKKMYGERLGDGVEDHLMSPTPRR